MADARSLQRKLEEGTLSAEEALIELDVQGAPTAALRMEACRVLGAIAGRAWGATWPVAERAAFVLLGVARETDAPPERARLLRAMGLGFRNAWLMPYVHSRLSDESEQVVAAAIDAAGGLAFPALEETIAAFLSHETRALRHAAIRALGRMGAESAAARLADLARSEPALALGALTEIRSTAGEAAALDVLAHDPPHDVVVAAVRYLAEIGNPKVAVTLRKLVREEDPSLRIIAGLVSRALEAEQRRDPGERILAALGEKDRAARAALARRLRTLPVDEMLEQAAIFLADDAEGVIQIVSEVRAPAVTRLLLRIASDSSMDIHVRARAAGSIEANEGWERDALVELATGSPDAEVRVAATQTIGAFAPLAYLIEKLGGLIDDKSPAVRGALIWAVQIAARAADRASATAIVKRALADADPIVRRRAAYVAGNLDAEALIPELVDLARNERGADIRVAAFVALAQIRAPSKLADIVHLWNREDDPEVLEAASRAMDRSFVGDSAPASVSRTHDRLRKLFGSSDARIRAAAARVAGLAPGGSDALVSLTQDPSPRVREQAVIALGRTQGASAPLVRALADVDLAVQERAAEALLSLGSIAPVIEWVSRTPDREAALRIASRISISKDDEEVKTVLGAAVARVSHDDPIYEILLELKVRLLETNAPVSGGPSIDATIAALFPTWPKLSAARGFEPLARSLRTAEMLQSAAGVEADMSAPIILWMKCLEGYMNAWLGPRLQSMQQQPSTLWELTDRLTSSAWPAYQRWLGERWTDPVKVGGLSVEVPLRSVTNTLREFQERRLKSLDSSISVTDWSRMMLFFAIDHPSGAKNVLKVTTPSPDRAARLVHRLQVLAHVRNVVTHRSVAGASTLTEFRNVYYAAFEELTAMAR